MADLWKQLEAARTPISTLRPPGSFTLSEYKRKFGLKECGAKKELALLVQAGKLKKHGERPAFYTFIGK